MPCPLKQAIRYDVQLEIGNLPTDTAIQYLIKACGHAFWRRGSGVTDTKLDKQTIQLNEYCYEQYMFLTVLCDCFVFVSCIALPSPYTLTLLCINTPLISVYGRMVSLIQY